MSINANKFVDNVFKCTDKDWGNFVRTRAAESESRPELKSVGVDRFYWRKSLSWNQLYFYNRRQAKSIIILVSFSKLRDQINNRKMSVCYYFYVAVHTLSKIDDR